MRPCRWLLAVLACAVLATVAPAQAQRNTIVVVEEGAPAGSSDLLDATEIARVERLQNGGLFVSPLSPVSPDDQVVLIGAGEQLGFMDIDDGSSVRLPLEAFGSLVPLPLLGTTEFSWFDERTLASIAIDFASENEENLFFILLIDRITLELRALPLRFPADTLVISVAPDLANYLLLQAPPEEEDGADLGATRVRVGRPTPSLLRADWQAPPALQRKLDRALAARPGLLKRFAMLRQEQPAADGALAVTNRTLDLLRYHAPSGQIAYVSTLPQASFLLGDAWTRTSGRVAISFAGILDASSERLYDGALLSEELYRDLSGNLPPQNNPLLQNNTTYLVDPASGAVQILRETAPGAPLLGAESWATDGQTLLVRAWHPARLKGRRHPIYTPQFSERVSWRFYSAELRLRNELAADLVSSPIFNGGARFVSPDEVIFGALSGTDLHPYYYNRASGEFRNIADRAGAYALLTPTNRSRQLVFTYTSFTTPFDIYRVRWDGSALARLTWFNEELRQEAGLREDKVSFRLRSGQTRTGVLIQPADAPFPPRGRPLVVWQEGGPGVWMVSQWLANVENPYALLPNFDLPLLVVPLAGRPGYSPAVFNSLVDLDNYGEIDIDEQAEIVRQLIDRGWTARGRVGIVGCSYGGYFALQSVIRHPDLYAAANPQCAYIDLIADWLRGTDPLVAYMQGLPPYAFLEEYRADSPAFNAARIKAAVLTFHGSEDFLPITLNENLHLQLVNRGLPARMIKFVGEGHGLGDPANQLYAAQEQISWFRTYLKP